MKALARVVLVGRTNVGKSSLFNRLAVDAKSIIFDVPGVTRDFITDEVSWKDRHFELVDTGGISLRKTTDTITEQVRRRALVMLEKSDVLLFVVDASAGLLPEDQEIADVIRKNKKPIILVINKGDAKEAADNLYEFDQLGFNNTIIISAMHGKGIADLLDILCQLLPETTLGAIEKPTFKVVLLGKPNVGKSSLLNLLINDERSIVTPIAGTTREPINERITFYQEDVLITDTAGIRRRRSISEPLETIMVKTSFKALERADIVLLLIDSSEGAISDQEWKLAFYAFEHYKALILLYNKNDLVNEESQKRLSFDNELYEHFLQKIPSLNISCKTSKNVGKILPLIQKVWERYSMKFVDAEVTMLFEDALMKRPLYHKTQLLRLYRAKQVGTAPITFQLLVNESAWFGSSQLAFFEHCLRQEYDLKGAPIRFIVRKP